MRKLNKYDMPIETVGVGEAITVNIIRAATSEIYTTLILSAFVAFILGTVFYIKRK